MALTLNPYVNLRGTAREALEFYRSVLGGAVQISTFADFPDPSILPEEQELVMHGQLSTDDGFVIMVSDTPSKMDWSAPASYSLSISGDESDRLQAIWDGLSDGAAITAPYTTPPWGGTFGMLTDRFGVDWMVMCEPASPTPEA